MSKLVTNLVHCIQHLNGGVRFCRQVSQGVAGPKSQVPERIFIAVIHKSPTKATRLRLKNGQSIFYHLLNPHHHPITKVFRSVTHHKFMTSPLVKNIAAAKYSALPLLGHRFSGSPLYQVYIFGTHHKAVRFAELVGNDLPHCVRNMDIFSEQAKEPFC